MSSSESEPNRLSADELHRRLKEAAGDLHDGLLQYVIAARMLNETLSRRLASQTGELPKEIEAVDCYLQQAIAEGRRLIGQLEATPESDLDLDRNLQLLIRQLENNTDLSCKLQIKGALNVDPSIRRVIYRVVQEALANVHRHSRANEVEVTVTRDTDRLRVRVRDDGQGFNIAAVPEASYGLRNMAKRAEAIGAELQIEAGVGHGTQITLDVPLVHNG